MKKLLTNLFLFSLTIFLIQSGANAIDFDLDGYDDFVLININSKSRLEWSAIDVNDAARRSMGLYGRAGDHLAVGKWSGAGNSSRGFINKKENGEFQWNIQLPGGQKSLTFGSHPDTVISGFDFDQNGAIDPVVLTVIKKKYIWKVMQNPALNVFPAVAEYTFGSKGETPFYANPFGTGDTIATAKVSNKKVLSIRYLNLTSGKIKNYNIKNFPYKINKVIPVRMPNGKDSVYIISKHGKNINLSLIKGSRKTKNIKIKGDEVVVGNYLASGEVLVVRNNSGKATFINTAGKKSSMALDLDAVLVDEVNINKFTNSDSPGSKPQPPAPNLPAPAPAPAPGTPQEYPVCAGVMLSTDHLLYKPVSDTSGNAVIVFDSKFNKEFLSVKIQLKDDTYSEGWWKGLELWGNPDAGGNRQHWRTNVSAYQVKDNALIVADDGTQICQFMIPGSANKRWE